MALFRRTKLFIFLTNSLIVLHQFFQNDQYCLLPEPIAKVVIPVQTGIQEFLQHIEKTGFPLSWE